MTNPIERANRSKRQSRGWSDDMDGHAISRRLAIVEELYSTWLALKNARKLPPPPVAPGVIRPKPPVVNGTGEFDPQRSRHASILPPHTPCDKQEKGKNGPDEIIY
jgi:hypothetical protein